MEKRNFGRSGLKASVLGLGTFVMGGARRPVHMPENARGGEIVISDEDIARMTKDIEEKTA